MDFSRRTMMRTIAGVSVAPAVLTVPGPVSAAGVVPSASASSYFDVREFGAVGDGRTDDTLALQGAIDAALDAGGGTILVPAGSYVHSGLTIGREGYTAMGCLRLQALSMASHATSAHREGTRLLCSSPTRTHLYVVDTQRVEIEGLSFAPVDGVEPTAGHAVHVHRGQRCIIRDCLFSSCWDTLFIEEHFNPILENVQLSFCSGRFGFRISGSEKRKISWGHVSCLFVNSNIRDGSPTTDGIQIGDNTHSIQWYNCHALWMRRGLVIGDGITKGPHFHRFENFETENCFSDGIAINSGSHLFFDSGYSCIHNGHGVVVASTYDKGGPIFFTDCRLSGNAKHGALLEACPGISFKGCRLGMNSNPGQKYGGTANTYDGIRVTAPKAFLDVIGCHVGGNIATQSDTTGTQGYGIYLEESVTTSSLRVIGNDLSGNGLGPIIDRSAGASTKVIFGNIGPGLQGTEDRDLGVVAAASIRPVFEVPVHRVTVAGDVEIDLSAAGFPVGRLGTMEVVVRMDSVGGHAVAFRGVTHWHDGASPRLATAAGALNRLTFCSNDGGQTVMGTVMFRSHRPA